MRRSFWMDMSRATTKRDTMPNLNLVMATLEREQETMVMAANEDYQSFAVIDVNANTLRKLRSGDIIAVDDLSTEDISYSFHSIRRSGQQVSDPAKPC